MIDPTDRMQIGDRFRDLEAIAAALRERGKLTPGTKLVPLAGGVSSWIALVLTDPPFVAKAARNRLAVAQEWVADPTRSLREGAVLELLDGRLGPMRVPRVLFIERDLNLLGLEAILPLRPTWREDLLDGQIDTSVAEQLGAAMAALHQLKPTKDLADEKGMALFEALRVDPYYRQVSNRFPDLASTMDELASELLHPALPALVQGDVTPKNVIPGSPRATLLDFEVIHMGQAAFDPAMLFAHFTLKAVYGRDPARARAFGELIHIAWQAYRSAGGTAHEEMVVRHTAGIVLARLFGKSQVHYLTRLEREAADQVARSLLRAWRPLAEFATAIEHYL